MPENTVRIDRHMPGIWLDRLVTQKVTETLNAMLDTEAGELVRASRYERSGGRKAYRADRYLDMSRLGGTLEEASWSSFPGRP